MTNILIASLATACILTAVESLIFSLGKFRGLLALVASVLMLLGIGIKASHLAVYGLAVTFLGLVMAIVVEEIFSGIDAKQLPKRIPMR